MIAVQPEDEWKLEQGLAAAELPIRDQTLPEGQFVEDVPSDPELEKVLAEAKDFVEKDEIDRDTLFAEERPGWRG
jgi:hypothetical protein